jgi:alkyldihydroxyacetonephosphate synthase
MGYLDELKRFFGDRFSQDEEVLMLYWRDYWPLSLLEETKGKVILPKAVVWPKSIDEIIYLVKTANKLRFKITPYGGGSGVIGAIKGGDVIVDLRGLNKILEVNEEDFYIMVEAGAYLKEIEEYLNSLGYTLRHIPQSYPETVIGGLISTLSMGQYSTKYGGIENMVLNLEVVLPNGDITWLRKNTVPRSAIQDLRFLFLGGEGKFGIITKAILKIHPIPRFIWKNSYLCDDFIQANYIIRDLIRSGIYPAVIRIYDKNESQIRFGVDGVLILLIVEEHDKSILDSIINYVNNKFVECGFKEIGEKPIDKWLKNRFNTINEIINYLIPTNLWFDTIDTAVLWSKFPNLYKKIYQELMKLKGVKYIMSHSSHFYLNGISLYFTVIYEPDEKIYWKIWDTAMRVILNNGGTISHHHGSGRLRRRWVKTELNNSYKFLKRIQASIDVNKVFGGNDDENEEF